jgi:hypothetical protein
MDRYLGMSSQEGSELKYSYRFTLEARRGESNSAEQSEAELQAYVNELLGVRKSKGLEDDQITV